ncbi:hypothetical protein M5K25_009870 [Dendrobium thyrsiflorum]|uniref:Uncharacterized protein n=1 Tax=Dendrobium thyrsiflorum TaxID=117978 RepID=A0ABD0V7W7_DENTH
MSFNPQNVHTEELLRVKFITELHQDFVSVHKSSGGTHLCFFRVFGELFFMLHVLKLIEHIICLINSISQLPYPFVESRVLIADLCLVSGKDDSLDLGVVLSQPFQLLLHACLPPDLIFKQVSMIFPMIGPTTISAMAPTIEIVRAEQLNSRRNRARKRKNSSGKWSRVQQRSSKRRLTEREDEEAAAKSIFIYGIRATVVAIEEEAEEVFLSKENKKKRLMSRRQPGRLEAGSWFDRFCSFVREFEAVRTGNRRLFGRSGSRSRARTDSVENGERRSVKSS